LSTHDLELARDMDRVLVVDAGRIVFDGDPAAAVAHYRALSAAGLPAPDGGLHGGGAGGPDAGRPERARLEQP
jgi:biotin transport system ATP-binding protein